jgi:hypothetical protein
MIRKCHFIATMLLVVMSLAACSDHNLLPDVNQVTPPSETHKRIALLCMLSDVNYDLIAASEQELRNNTLRINDALQNRAVVRDYIGPDWQVVWGPAISSSVKKSGTSEPNSFVTDNTMYVARGTDLATGKSMYVVSIAGTNAVSRKGAFSEDFNVFTEKEWQAPNSGKISAGSALGLDILNSMADPVNGKTLIQFLSTLKDAGPVQVAFTGHSLGGALSPLMALKFIEYKQQMGYTNIDVSVYPIAGPTPGDKAFALYAAEQFGAGYHSVINTNDIVVYSWQKDMFAKIPSLYKHAPPFNPGGKKGFTLPLKEQLAFDAIKLVIDSKTYQRIAPEREFVFQGKPNTYPNGSGSFFEEAKYQHVMAYFKDAFEFPEQVINAISN